MNGIMQLTTDPHSLPLPISVCLPFILTRSFCATLLFSLVFHLIFTISWTTINYVVFISSTIIDKNVLQKKKLCMNLTSVNLS